MLKNPSIRFKTIEEMIADYGTNWMDNVSSMIGPDDALHTMTLFQGKVLYPSLVHPTTWRTHFAYGPTSVAVCTTMLTTKQTPKYDARGNVLRPGMIVKIQYLAIGPNEKHIISANLRNKPGTLVKVLKVFKPSDYIKPDRMTGVIWDKVDKLCIVTELRDPFSGVSLKDASMMYSSTFKNNCMGAFEIMHKVCKATDIEREFYYKTL